MKRKMSKVSIALMIAAMAMLLCVVPKVLSAAEKIPESAWQMGMLVNVTSDVGPAGADGHADNNPATTSDKVKMVTHYTIDNQTEVYHADRVIKSKKDKPINVTVNAMVRFAVRGTDLFLTDNDGNVFQLTVQKKVMKTVGAGSRE